MAQRAQEADRVALAARRAFLRTAGEESDGGRQSQHAADAGPSSQLSAEDRAVNCGLGAEHATIVDMGFEPEAALEAINRAARNHTGAERQIEAAIALLVGAA